ncbi:hypothetical protein [Nonlabens sp.]|uniref:hypothetical protein n=1 Tax=Nonlabens sp. TaxID=1888209 RepID=UPI0032661E1E
MKKAKKITYLFGAGASYNAVPILNSLSYKMYSVADKLEKEVNRVQNSGNDIIDYSPFRTIVSEFCKDLRSLADKSNEYGTIDTYAKKLDLNEEKEELTKLKFLVSIFFTIWQGYFYNKEVLRGNDFDTIFYSDIDSRYKSLISNYLIKTKDSLPELDPNINFVSWNYDHQLESAFSLFFKNKLNLTEINEQIKFLPDSENVYAENRILHLNGISNFWIDDNKDLKRIFQNNDELEIESIIQRISELYKPSNFGKSESLINYAWDNNDSKIEEAKRIFNETDILVIIGYSFPTFNRAIDSRLLSGKSNSFDKIIYQDPNASKELLELFNIQFRNKVGNLVNENGQLQFKKETEQFFIPPEYFPQGEKVFISSV